MLEPTLDMWRALIDVRSRHGRRWKSALSLKWMNGEDEAEHFSASLRMIRNHFGPSWLYALRPARLDAMARHLAAHDALPEMCATHLAGTHDPIVIRRGASGYWPLSEGLTVAEINDLFGAGPAEIAAMEAGSMFGWTVPGSDPTRYDKDGRPSGARRA